MKRRQDAARADPGKRGLPKMLQGGRLQTIIAAVLSVLILAAFGFLGYALYDQFAGHTQIMGEETTPEEYVPLTHDELLGRPLSFETPAFVRIPAIDLKEEVREGSDDEDELSNLIAMGPVHITHTGFPGWDGNCVISGYRASYGKPFARLDGVSTGDLVYIDNPRGTYQYTVQEVYYTDPEKNVTLQTADPILTLTWSPERHTAQRLVVRGSLSDFVPVEVQENPPAG
jgi:LPXTG-site transpeptidase (sortase) family protein